MTAPKPRLDTLSLSQLSEVSGKVYRTVRRLLADAAVEPVRTDGKTLYYDAPTALAALFGIDRMDLSSERARLARAQSEAQEMRNAELRGELVRADQVEQALVATLSAVRSRLLSIPSATAQELAGAASSAECHAITERAIHDALQELSEAEVEGAKPKRRRATAEAAQ